MSILRKVKQFRELGRLRTEARTSPTPGTIGALAERYIALGRTEDAHRVAEAGLKRFPTSERLAAVRTFAKKQRLTSEITSLKREMSEHPTPAVYSRLAEIYRELGNFEQALSICEQCVERFPLNENPYLIIGEIRLTRFLQDQIAFDGLTAEKQLRRVVKLNAQNMKAHLLLAWLYHCVGALEETKAHVRSAIGLTPENPELEKFLRDLETRPQAFENALEPVESEDEEEDWDGVDDDPSIADLIRAVEARGTFRNRPEACPASRLLPASIGGPVARLDVENLKRNLRDVGHRPGVSNALILDRDGEILADCSQTDGLTRKQFSELVAEIQKTSEDASRRMDVGTFHWCTVEGAFGGIAINRVKNISVGMKFDTSLRPDRAQSLLDEFAARNLTAPPEVAHA